MALFLYCSPPCLMGDLYVFRVQSDSSLTRIIGTQPFKDLFHRSCYLQPTLSEPKTQLSQVCGGYINPGNFSIMPYITEDG